MGGDVAMLHIGGVRLACGGGRGDKIQIQNTTGYWTTSGRIGN